MLHSRYGLPFRVIHPCTIASMDAKFSNGKTLRLVIGDITNMRVDAIVNAANSQLRGGGGVDGAIHRAGGPTLMRELDQIRKESGTCATGGAVVTTAGALPAQYVFHTVGPIYQDGKHNEPELLANCYRKCLELAEEHGVRSISFPAISTGAYGYPADEAARIAIGAIVEHLRRSDAGVREVLFVLWDQGSYDTHIRVLSAIPAEPLE
jgi:O-acetyl-ADP-ribose deacetylase (regulator of RNase III)